jgi:hypothetical protein
VCLLVDVSCSNGITSGLFVDVSCSNQIISLDLTQLVRFLMVKLTHPDSNPRFDMNITFMTNYFFSGRRRPYQQ